MDWCRRGSFWAWFSFPETTGWASTADSLHLIKRLYLEPVMLDRQRSVEPYVSYLGWAISSSDILQLNKWGLLKQEERKKDLMRNWWAGLTWWLEGLRWIPWLGQPLQARLLTYRLVGISVQVPGKKEKGVVMGLLSAVGGNDGPGDSLLRFSLFKNSFF